MARVAFDEDDVPAVVPPPGSRRPPTARRRLLAAAAAVVVVAVAAVGTQRLLDARRESADAALDARYAHAVGVVAPFDAGIRVRTGPPTAVALESATVVGDTVVALQQGADWSLVGLDPDDWTTRWATPVDLGPADGERPYWVDDEDLERLVGSRDVDALAAARALVSATWCAPVPEDRALALCGLETGAFFFGAPLSSSWWVVDVADGEVVRAGNGGAGQWLRPVGDLLVRVHGVTAQGADAGASPPVAWSVEATDPLTADVRWTWTMPPTEEPPTEVSPAGRSGADPLVASDETPVPHVEFGTAHGGRVLVWSGSRAWVVDADGRLVEQATVGDGDGVVLGRHGRAAPLGARVTDDDGFARQESAVVVPVDDGTLPDVVLLTSNGLGSGELTARSSDGADRWGAPSVRLPLAVLDGDVLARTYTGLARLDGDDGSVVWSSDVGVDGDLPVTDGRTVLVRAGGTVRALSWATGVVEWERTLADLGLDRDALSLQVAPGIRRLVVATDDERLVLR